MKLLNRIQKFVNPQFRAPRLWSNTELRKVAKFVKGSVVNVSANFDEDKAGGYYRDYFINASSYAKTNWFVQNDGGPINSYFLDLETGEGMVESQYDCVLCHTVLEHVYQVFTAFRNLCALSRDLIIIVVPFMQEEHTNYGDYWRFTPRAVRKLFADNEAELIYINWNDRGGRDSIYIIAVARKITSKNQDNAQIRDVVENRIQDVGYYMLGSHRERNGSIRGIARRIYNTFLKD